MFWRLFLSSCPEVVVDWIAVLVAPALLSGVVVFVVSSVLHMLLPWHRNDYRTVPNQDQVMDALRAFAIPPGDYMLPRPSDMAEMRTPAFREKVERGPTLVMTIWPSGSRSMGLQLGVWFVYLVLVSGFAGHIADRAGVRANAHLLFHTVGLASFLGYAAALWQMFIWYRRSWVTTLRASIDGLIYAGITATIFVWLWAR
jgi:hypothetical protein